MFDFDENLKYIILLFILSSYIIYQSNCYLFFDENKKLKQFGLGSNKTILPFWLVLLLIASMIYIYIKHLLSILSPQVD